MVARLHHISHLVCHQHRANRQAACARDHRAIVMIETCVTHGFESLPNNLPGSILQLLGT